MFQIQSYGYTGGEEFSSLAEAKKVLKKIAAEDVEKCQKRFKAGKVNWIKKGESFKVEFGANLYSASWIAKII